MHLKCFFAFLLHLICLAHYVITAPLPHPEPPSCNPNWAQWIFCKRKSESTSTLSATGYCIRYDLLMWVYCCGLCVNPTPVFGQCMRRTRPVQDFLFKFEFFCCTPQRNLTDQPIIIRWHFLTQMHHGIKIMWKRSMRCSIADQTKDERMLRLFYHRSNQAVPVVTQCHP